MEKTTGELPYCVALGIYVPDEKNKIKSGSKENKVFPEEDREKPLIIEVKPGGKEQVILKNADKKSNKDAGELTQE